MGRRVAIVGSRSLNDSLEAKRKVEHLVSMLDPENDIVVTGGADGIDTFAEDAARSFGVGVLVFRPIPPPKDKRTRAGYIAALFERNTRIIDWSTEVHAFWDERSNGTADSINKAEKMHRLVKVWRFDNG